MQRYECRELANWIFGFSFLLMFKVFFRLVIIELLSLVKVLSFLEYASFLSQRFPMKPTSHLKDKSCITVKISIASGTSHEFKTIKLYLDWWCNTISVTFCHIPTGHLSNR